MQLDKVISVKRLFFTYQMITKKNILEYLIKKALRHSYFAGPSVFESAITKFYNNIKNTLFLNSVAHANSGLSLEAFP